MANIHNLEPQASGLIVFETTFGALELELFTKQCPKISRNFVQLCLDGYYNQTIFDRVEKDFIAVGGKLITDNKIQTDQCPDEFHSRLKFSRRGLLATANMEKDANGPEFFLTLGATPELQNKHSIFGRLKGDSVYHLVDLNECPVSEDFLPISQKRILDTIVQENPFPELEPRPDVVKRIKGIQNKDKSTTRTKRTTTSEAKSSNIKRLSFFQDDSDDDDDNADEDKTVSRDTSSDTKVENRGRENLQDDEFKRPSPKVSPEKHESGVVEAEDGDAKTEEAGGEGARQKRLREIKEQFQAIKKQLELESATKIRTLSDRRRSQDQDNSLVESIRSTSSKQSSLEDPDLSSHELRLATKKGRHRERETLDLMENFKKKLKNTLKLGGEGALSPNCEPDKRAAERTLGDNHDDGDDEEVDLDEALKLVDDDAWLRHRFDASDGAPRNAKDANQKGDDWYSIDDPRNPAAQRVEAERAREYRKHRTRDARYDDADGGRHHHHSNHSSSSSSRDRRNHHDHHHHHHHERSSSSNRRDHR